ncbi:MAG: heavy-metal-associated domain-containing protein [Oscillospiraceae bacterium]
MYQTTLKIDGMMCGMCESHINDTIRKAAPVKKVTSSHAKGEAVVLTDEPLDIEAVKAAVHATGYEVTDASSEPYEKRSSPFSRSDSLFLLSWKTALSPCRQSGFS